ncbi:MAG: single-stranded DNA-binding protein, partial [Rhabdochlamydiaceae bacterium]
VHYAKLCIMNNTITVIGYVGQNPHTISFEDTGNKLVKFSVAVKEFSSNTDEDKTMWIDVDAWKD